METPKRGVNVYLALENLLQLLGLGDGAGLLDERTLRAMPLELAFISDFTTRPLAGLESELFTAGAVGGLLVTACKAEGVILPEPDPTRGLAVRLHVELSPSVSLLVHQLNETTARAALMLIDDQLPANGSPVSWPFLGSVAGGLRAGGSALCNQPRAC
ncbi:MAG TPA: hypothetical protein VGB98_12270 [Pyrinomonadaceae bacterium]